LKQNIIQLRTDSASFIEKTERVRVESGVLISRRPEEDRWPVSGVLSRFVRTSHERPKEWC